MTAATKALLDAQIRQGLPSATPAAIAARAVGLSAEAAKGARATCRSPLPSWRQNWRTAPSAAGTAVRWVRRANHGVLEVVDAKGCLQSNRRKRTKGTPSTWGGSSSGGRYVRTRPARFRDGFLRAVGLSVWELRNRLVTETDHQGSLDHPRHADDGHNDHRHAIRPAFGNNSTELGQLYIWSGEDSHISGKSMKGGVGSRPSDTGLLRRTVPAVAIELLVSPVMEGGQPFSGDAELPFIRLDDIEGSEAVAPLVLDKAAVGAVELPCQGPERDASL
jgi:hypothetical protein